MYSLKSETKRRIRVELVPTIIRKRVRSGMGTVKAEMLASEQRAYQRREGERQRDKLFWRRRILKTVIPDVAKHLCQRKEEE